MTIALQYRQTNIKPADPNPANVSQKPVSLEQAYQQYHHLVLGVCLKYLKNKEDAKDAMMDIFHKLQTDLDRYEIEHFKSWLYQVTRNHCLEKLRIKKAINQVPIELVEHEKNFMEFPTFDTHNNNHCSDETIHGAIEQLKSGQCQCVRLFYLEEKSYKEIAEITGYHLKQVKSHIQNGRMNLKQILIKTLESAHAP